MNEQQFRKTWEKDIEKFKKIRRKYLIYPNQFYNAGFKLCL